MKKLILSLLIIAISISCIACSNQDEPSQGEQNSSEVSQEPTAETSEEISQEPTETSEVSTEPQTTVDFEVVLEINDKLSIIKKDDKYALIDETDKLIVNYCDKVYYLYDLIFANKTDSSAVLNTDGEFVVPFGQYNAFGYTGTILYTHDGDKYVLLKKDGSVFDVGFEVNSVYFAEDNYLQLRHNAEETEYYIAWYDSDEEECRCEQYDKKAIVTEHNKTHVEILQSFIEGILEDDRDLLEDVMTAEAFEMYIDYMTNDVKDEYYAFDIAIDLLSSAELSITEATAQTNIDDLYIYMNPFENGSTWMVFGAKTNGDVFDPWIAYFHLDDEGAYRISIVAPSEM